MPEDEFCMSWAAFKATISEAVSLLKRQLAFKANLKNFLNMGHKRLQSQKL